MLPLSKIMDMPGDLLAVSAFVQGLLKPERYPDLLAGQHEARRWEYGMALEAISQWQSAQLLQMDPVRILDAGSATSNLWQALTAITSEDIIRIDPLFDLSIPPPELGQFIRTCADLDRYARVQQPSPVDVITAISVIEHIPDQEIQPGTPTDLQRFLQAAHDLLRPGGLVVLTTDFWEGSGPDTAHFHWMRERIYNRLTLRLLEGRLQQIGFAPFGDQDFSWYGPQVYDYAMAALVMVKKESR